jgi:GMP synthase (glutamine-hydrolysing)
MKITEIIHDEDFLLPSNIDKWVQKNDGVTTQRILASSLEFPPLQSYDLLILHGGVQHLWDKRSDKWLIKETEYVKTVLQNKKPVIGFCLGCQIIAQALGAYVFNTHNLELGFYNLKIRKSKKSIGIIKGLEDGFESFSWHQDHFELPKSCTSPAFSKLTKNQIIVSDTFPVVGFQFHPEYTKEIIRNYASQMDSAKWKTINNRASTKIFLKWLESCPDTFPLFEQLMENSLAYFDRFQK